MALYVNVSLLNGDAFVIDVNFGCCVRDLKRAIERKIGLSSFRQKLVASDGVVLTDELDLGEMYDFDDNDDQVEVTLVELLKSEEEILHTERWLRDAPKWLVDCTETTLNADELYKFKLDYYDFQYKQLSEAERKRMRYCPPVRHSVSGRRQGYEPQQATTPPTLTTSDEIIKFISQYDYCLGEPEGGLVPVRPLVRKVVYGSSASEKIRYAEEAVVLAAIEREPGLMLDYATRSMVTIAARRIPGIFRYLGPYYQSDKDILDAALNIDKELRAEFLLTAGASEIQEWRWRSQSRRQEGVKDESTAKRIGRKKPKK